jgi:hypothetical protein
VSFRQSCVNEGWRIAECGGNLALINIIKADSERLLRIGNSEAAGSRFHTYAYELSL